MEILGILFIVAFVALLFYTFGRRSGKGGNRARITQRSVVVTGHHHTTDIVDTTVYIVDAAGNMIAEQPSHGDTNACDADGDGDCDCDDQADADCCDSDKDGDSDCGSDSGDSGDSDFSYDPD